MRTKKSGNIVMLIAFVILVGVSLLLTLNMDKEEVNAPYKEGAVTEPAGVTDNAVACIYLTVTRGNAVEGTDNSWEEMNSLYLAPPDGEVFAVEGLLQIGDGSGPVIGEFGYDSAAPNSMVAVYGTQDADVPQKSYIITLRDKSDRFFGEKSFVLNKHIQDSLRFRSKLAYDVAGMLGNMPVPETEFVHLFVRDETDGASDVFYDYGLYTMSESITGGFLQKNGLDMDGALYKAVDFSFERYEGVIELSSSEYYDIGAFEAVLEIMGDTDHTKLISMLSALNNPFTPIAQVIEEYFDEENYHTWLAFQILLDNCESACKDFYLYTPPGGSKFFFIMQDAEKALLKYEQELTAPDLGATRSEAFLERFSPAPLLGSVLHRRVLMDSELTSKLGGKLFELMEIVNAEELELLITQYRDAIESMLFALPDSDFMTLSRVQYGQVVAALPGMVQDAYSRYLEFMSIPTPFALKSISYGDESVTFECEPSTFLRGGDVTYTFELSADFTFNSLLAISSGVSKTVFTVDKPEAGQYFLRVTASDGGNNDRNMSGCYKEFSGEIHTGVLCFYIQRSGEVVAGVGQSVGVIREDAQ